jgi:hypothetical protein
MALQLELKRVILLEFEAVKRFQLAWVMVGTVARVWVRKCLDYGHPCR